MPAVETWPTYAIILGDGFEPEREPLSERVEMSSGPPKTAQVKSRGMIRFPCRVLLETRTDYRAFIAWFKVNIHNGADWFWWYDPFAGRTREAHIVRGIEKETCASPGKLLNFILSLTLEVWDV